VKIPRPLTTFAGVGVLTIGVIPAVLVGASSSSADTTSTITIQVAADTTVNSAQPETTRGSANWVTTDGSPLRYGFYRFDVSLPSGATVSGAEFRCQAGSSNSIGASLWTTSNDWDEQTATWANAPLPDVSQPPVGRTGPVVQDEWASADVTGAVTGGGSYTFVTRTTSSTAWSCRSRENSHGDPAELVLTIGAAGPTPTPTPTPTPPPPPAAGAHKVLVIPLENHSESEALSQMPTLATWATRYGQATSYYAITHPSLPNYLAIWGGDTFGVTTDCSVGASGCVPSAPTVWRQTLAAGESAKAYQESMSTNCETSASGEYAPRHGPWAYWTDATDRSDCQAYDVPSGTTVAGNLVDDVRAGNLPVTGELTPNLCNDAHDCALSVADGWLGNWLPVITAGPDFVGGRLTVIVTFDEDDSSQSNKVAFVVIDPRLNGVTVTGAFNHYGLTRWLDENAGVALLRNAGTAADLKAAFGL
jgi:hypothetical protein